MELYAGVARFDITPDYPVSLLGYFNDRISTGIHDPLYCRLLALSGNGAHIMIVQIDTCLVPTSDAEYLRSEISGATDFGPDQILICTNHSHTAPALADFFEVKAEKRYRRELFGAILEQVRRLKPLIPCTVHAASTSAPGLSHNRRWFMKNGTVTTNPPRGGTGRVMPEGAVDDGVEVIGLIDPKGEPLVLIVSISNHTDTVGGTGISADWTGCMERAVRKGMGENVTVLPLIAPQGNINHYDFDTFLNQTSPEEADRIGRAYAGIVLSGWGESRHLTVDRLGALFRCVEIGPREVDARTLQRAREILEHTVQSPEEADLKAEDLETPEVQHLFARELVTFYESKPVTYHVPLQVLYMGEVIFCAIPGEPFVEIGLELKRMLLSVPDGAPYSASTEPGGTVIPVALANGYFGYIPLEDCFDRGGYEVRPGRNNCLSRNAAGIVTAELKSMVRSTRAG